MSKKTRHGRLARLPSVIREELNRRLYENELASTIVEWLNGLEVVKTICDENGTGPINRMTLSNWRMGGYQDWLTRREHIDRTRELGKWAVRLSRAHGVQISEGTASILSAKVLEVLEGINRMSEIEAPLDEDGEPQPITDPTKLLTISKALESVTMSLAKIRSGDHKKIKLDLDARKIEQADEVIKQNWERIKDKAAERLLDSVLRAKVENIAGLPWSNAQKIAAIRQAAFADVDKLASAVNKGAMPDDAPEPPPPPP